MAARSDRAHVFLSGKILLRDSSGTFTASELYADEPIEFIIWGHLSPDQSAVDFKGTISPVRINKVPFDGSFGLHLDAYLDVDKKAIGSGFTAFCIFDTEVSPEAIKDAAKSIAVNQKGSVSVPADFSPLLDLEDTTMPLTFVFQKTGKTQTSLVGVNFSISAEHFNRILRNAQWHEKWTQDLSVLAIPEKKEAADQGVKRKAETQSVEDS
eukprot:TRINITY_DN22676_c0_g1_i1.p1 TRINITY_DN22676_c0_g1~~TRINITY_DN22676_c0_g1_i1.p1  ORF type:complete len:211 (-),score=44.85 TRINITY_DN22676_c0_g1_i1:573-1205(-)